MKPKWHHKGPYIVSSVTVHCPTGITFSFPFLLIFSRAHSPLGSRSFHHLAHLHLSSSVQKGWKWTVLRHVQLLLVMVINLSSDIDSKASDEVPSSISCEAGTIHFRSSPITIFFLIYLGFGALYQTYCTVDHVVLGIEPGLLMCIAFA